MKKYHLMFFDLWNSGNQDYDYRFIMNLFTYCNENNLNVNFNKKIISSYDLNIDNYFIKKLIQNTFLYFTLNYTDEVKWYLYDIFRQSLKLNNSFSKGYDRILIDSTVSDEDVLCLNEKSLSLFLKTEKIENVIIVGGAWEQCIQNRPVGLNKLINITHTDFYIIPEFISKMNNSNMSEDDLNNYPYSWETEINNLDFSKKFLKLKKNE